MVRGRPVQALLTLALLLAAPACTGTGTDTPASGPTTTAPTDIAATPGAPSWSGEMPVTLAAGSKVLTPLRCTPSVEAQLVCDTDDATYHWVGTPVTATLLSARASLDRGHTSWRAVFRFAGATPASVARVARRAAVEGLLLVQNADGLVLVALTPPAVRGDALVLGQLEKGDAWQFVRSVAEP